MLKLLKERSKFLRYFNETLKLSTGLERFLTSFIFTLLICHLVACIWYLITLLNTDKEYDNWTSRLNILDEENFDKYSKKLYEYIYNFNINYKLLHFIGLFKLLLLLDMGILTQKHQLNSNNY